MKYLAALVLIPTVTLSQVVSHSQGVGDRVCPLSDSQTEKSLEAFDRIMPTLTQEPRCVNCHGGVNPFIDGVGDPADPQASRTEHGGGKMEDGNHGTDCETCHSNLAPRRDGRTSYWKLAPIELFFAGKDAPTLCAQLHDRLPGPGDLVEHFRDDIGGDNFVGTSFMGNRGLDAEQFAEIPPQPPRGIDPAGLIKLGQDWLDTTSGEFQGQGLAECGCKPLHYAIRVSAATQIDGGAIQFKSTMAPAEIPITFADDGTFAGEGVVTFAGQSTVKSCSAEYASSLRIRASGRVLSNHEDGQQMKLKLEDLGPPVTSVSAECPIGSFSRPNVPSNGPRTVMAFDKLDGQVGEFAVYQVPGLGAASQLRVEIVKVAEPAK